jgi:hypothetical protein
VSELIDLSAAAAAERIRARELDQAELFDAYRERAEANDLNAFTWVADGPPARNGYADKPLGGVPVAVKDLFCTEGVPSQSGSKIIEGYRPPYTATVVSKLDEAGAPLLGKTNQDEFAMGSSNENSAFGPVLNPWDRDRVPGGSSAGSAVRDRGAEADLRRVLALRHDRVRVLARSGRPVDARRDRRGTHVRADDRPRPARLDLARVPGGDRAAAGGGSKGHPARRARGVDGRRQWHRTGGAR